MFSLSHQHLWIDAWSCIHELCCSSPSAQSALLIGHSESCWPRLVMCDCCWTVFLFQHEYLLLTSRFLLTSSMLWSWYKEETYRWYSKDTLKSICSCISGMTAQSHLSGCIPPIAMRQSLHDLLHWSIRGSLIGPGNSWLQLGWSNYWSINNSYHRQKF